MTIAPDAPRLQFATLEEAIARMRERGLRLSAARHRILEALFAADGPVAAPYLVETLAIEESSAYRNLEVLESHGFVRHVHLGHGPGLYALLGGDEAEYLYCERCAKVTAVGTARLDGVREAMLAEFAFQPRFTHFAIVGRCVACARSGDAARGADPAPHSHGDHVHSHPHAGPEHRHRGR